MEIKKNVREGIIIAAGSIGMTMAMQRKCKEIATESAGTIMAMPTNVRNAIENATENIATTIEL